MYLVLFIFFGGLCVAGALNLLFQRHPINSALSLIVVIRVAVVIKACLYGCCRFHTYLAQIFRAIWRTLTLESEGVALFSHVAPRQQGCAIMLIICRIGVTLRGRALGPGGLPRCVAADHALLETTFDL